MHVICAAVHALSALLIFLIEPKGDFYFFVNHITPGEPFRQEKFNSHPFLWLAFNEALTALFHLWRHFRGGNRWLSYSITAGLLSVAVPFSSGPLNLLFLPFILLGNLALQSLGDWIERRGDRSAFLLGFFILLPGIVLSATRTALVQTETFIPLSLLSVLYAFFYLTFPLFLYLTEFDFCRAFNREIGFVILSLTSKLVLSWLLVAILMEVHGDPFWSSVQVGVLSIGLSFLLVGFTLLGVLGSDL